MERYQTSERRKSRIKNKERERERGRRKKIKREICERTRRKASQEREKVKQEDGKNLPFCNLTV